MKNVIFGVLMLGISFSGIGQNLDNYLYVRVPEQFEFQKSENQYQLNALTAFLFDKYGFYPLYKKETPAGVDRCSILEADVIDDSGLFTTKVYVTLTNCKKELVFTSQTGKSKEKEFKKSFQEALREAFKSVGELEYYPPEVIIDPVVSAKKRAEVVNDSVEDIEVMVDFVVSAEEREELEKEMEADESRVKASAEVILVNGSEVYKLSKTPSGFELFKEASREKFAQLVRSNGGDFYHYSSEKVNGIAFFDLNGSLVVEYIDQAGGQMVTLIFRKQN